MSNAYPPFLDKTMELCPQASYLYTKIWRERGDDFVLTYSKSKIKDEYCMNWRTFNTALRLLSRHNCIRFKFDPFKEHVQITLMHPDFNEKIAC